MNKLICFTYAGGNASFYDKLETIIGSSVKIIKLEYAGHGTRMKENLYNSFDELAHDMYSQIKKYVNPCDDYALFGYSMGSLSLTETLNKIMVAKELKIPKHIFLAAYSPFQHNDGDLDSIDDKFVIDRTIAFGGLPQSLVSNKSFWRLYLPIYKSDYRLILGYKCSYKSKVSIPVTVFYSKDDTPIREMKDWEKVYGEEIEYIEFSGPHFFIKDNYNEIANIICNRLA